MKNEKGVFQYQKYYFSKMEAIRYGLEGVGLDLCISYLFYRSYIAFFLLLPIAFFYLKYKKEELCIKRLESLKQQFKDGIQAVLAALDAGYSLENAFEEALIDLRLLYENENDIIREFQTITKGIQMNRPVEELLKDFANRSGLEDILSFSEIFVIAKRKGGNLLLIIRSTVQLISEKLEVQQEIQTIIAGKRLEQRIMNFIPFGILFYVDLTSDGFLDKLYGNYAGIIIMTVCLMLYFFAVMLSKKIMRVEV